MSTEIRRLLRDRYIDAIASDSKLTTDIITEFVDHYVAGRDGTSQLMELTQVKTKATVLRWKKRMKAMETQYQQKPTPPDGYETLGGGSEASAPEVGSGGLEAELEPTSREYQLLVLGESLKAARAAKKHDQIVRVSAAIAKIQGFEAKTMGRVYDAEQELGEEGLKAVDRAAAVRVLAFTEHPEHYPMTCQAILDAAAALEGVKLGSGPDDPKSRRFPYMPVKRNDALDARPRYVLTAQIAHETPQSHKPDFLTPDSTPAEVERLMAERTDEGLEPERFLDDVTEDLQ